MALSSKTIENFGSPSSPRAATSSLHARAQAPARPSTNVHTDLALAWLKNELGADFVEGEWTVRVRYDAQQQENYSDCGVFCATTAKMTVLGWNSKSAYEVNYVPADR